MARSLLLSSAQVAVFINGNLYGRAAGLNYSVETPRPRRQCVDTVLAFELGLGPAVISGSLSMWRASQDGAAEGPGMVAPLDEITREKYFTLILIDLTTSTIIFQADHCSVESQSWSIGAKSLITGTVNFSALSYQNEVRPLG